MRQEIVKARFFIKSRAEETFKDGSMFMLEYVRHLYKLNDLEYFALLMSILGQVDNRYSKTFALLQNDPEKTYPDVDLMLKVYYFVEDTSEINDFYSIKHSLLEKMVSLCFEAESNIVSPRILSFIMTNGMEPLSLNGVESIIPGFGPELPIKENVAAQLKDLVYSYDDNESLYICVNGPDGIGKKTQIKRCAELLGVALILVDVSKLNLRDGKEFYKAILTACREVLLTRGAICFSNFEKLDSLESADADKATEILLNTCEKFSNVIFITAPKPIRERKIVDNYLWLNVTIDYPNKDESITLWESCLENIQLKEKVEAFEMANKFTFTPAQILGTQRDAKNLSLWHNRQPITRKELYDCAYNQIISDLSKKSTLIYARYNWDQLILADREKEVLKNACDQIKYKHIVYDKWGFNKRLAYGRGVSMLFAGPPGTGKTMAAQVIGNELNIEIYKVDLSQVVSKYIGETEKNLGELFNEAKKSNVILFFDETDALLGKRTEVKDSHDKNANLETSYLLQKMEEYDGITIMTTNYLENIDQAFFRRISYVIHFPFPDVPSRKQIWMTMFPKEVPLAKDIDFDYLANQFEISGGNIKNIAVTAAFLAAKSDKKLRMKHIIQAIKYELTKQGKTLLKEDFGEHGYLL